MDAAATALPPPPAGYTVSGSSGSGSSGAALPPPPPGYDVQQPGIPGLPAGTEPPLPPPYPGVPGLTAPYPNLPTPNFRRPLSTIPGEGTALSQFMEPGIEQGIEGVEQMANPNAAGTTPGRQIVGGASKAFRGGMKAAAPIILPMAGATAPLPLITGTLAGMGVGEGTEQGLKMFGVSPEYAEGAGDVAGTGAGALAAGAAGALQRAASRVPKAELGGALLRSIVPNEVLKVWDKYGALLNPPAPEPVTYPRPPIFNRPAESAPPSYPPPPLFQRPAPPVAPSYPPPPLFTRPGEPAPVIYPKPPIFMRPPLSEPPAGASGATTLTPAPGAPAAAPPGASVVPPNVETFRHPAAHTDVIRQMHAVGKELGFGHDQLSGAAKTMFGVDSLSKLTYDQALKLNEYLLANKSLPK